MGDINQRIYLERHVPKHAGPVIEIGSRDYGNTTSFRDLYAGVEYVGVDLSDGKDVDRVVDLTEGIGDLPEGHFGLAICCSVLEHTPRPWILADNLSRLLRPGGALYLSVPWVWRYHPYPDDYFRFSFRSFAGLFPDLDWGAFHYSSNVEGEILEITDPGLDNQMHSMAQTPDGRRRKYLPYLMVNSIGRKRA